MPPFNREIRYKTVVNSLADRYLFSPNDAHNISGRLRTALSSQKSRFVCPDIMIEGNHVHTFMHDHFTGIRKASVARHSVTPFSPQQERIKSGVLGKLHVGYTAM